MGDYDDEHDDDSNTRKRTIYPRSGWQLPTRNTVGIPVRVH